jgi:hypothetical protein
LLASKQAACAVKTASAAQRSGLQLCTGRVCATPPAGRFHSCPFWSQRSNLYHRLIHKKIHSDREKRLVGRGPHYDHVLLFFARAALLARALTQVMLHAGCMLALHRYLRRPLQPALAHGSGFGG